MSEFAHTAPTLRAGDRVLIGSELLEVSAEFVASLEAGDRVVGVAGTRSLKRIPADVSRLVHECVGRSVEAFQQLQSVADSSVTDFFESAARLLEDDEVVGLLREANAADVRSAIQRHRSSTRLVLSETMLRGMIEALRMWRDLPVGRESILETTAHHGWSVEQVRSPLGVVAFVFEGRPNVFADATGVLRTGNSVVFRIGSDALGTARALMQHVVSPALERSGLPREAVQLVDSAEHAAGWAVFSDARVSLAVARGSGHAVAELGAIARQTGIPVSLHGTGGAWMVVGDTSAERLTNTVVHSLDRKVCNTLNTVCVLARNAESQLPLVVDAAQVAAQKIGTDARIHCVNGAERHLQDTSDILVHRADGEHREPRVSADETSILGREFEWEKNPEIAVVVVDSVTEAIELFNRHSPHFVVSCLSDDDRDHAEVWSNADAPFVGDGFTRWVDGQFALLRPELGLSNWQSGRLFGRGAVLSGDSVFTVRYRMRQTDESVHR